MTFNVVEQVCHRPIADQHGDVRSQLECDRTNLLPQKRSHWDRRIMITPSNVPPTALRVPFKILLVRDPDRSTLFDATAIHRLINS